MDEDELSELDKELSGGYRVGDMSVKEIFPEQRDHRSRGSWSTRK